MAEDHEEERLIRSRVSGEVAAKWSHRVVSFGYTAVPILLMRFNRFAPPESKLHPTEFMVLLVILSYWWRENDYPYPAVKTIASDVGVSTRQVLRTLRKLEAKGLLRQVKLPEPVGGKSYGYSPAGLVRLLHELARRAMPRQGALPIDLSGWRMPDDEIEASSD